MLRHVQAIDAGLVGRLDEGQALVKERRERAVAVLDVIEQSDFHDSRPIVPILLDSPE